MNKKIRSFLLFFLFAVILAVPGYANAQKIYGTDSAEYKTLSLLNSLADGSPLSDSGPWSLAEMRHMLRAVNPDRLGTPGTASRDIYAALEEQLGPNSRPPSITFTARLNAEVYAHTNSTEFFDEDEEWAYDYTQRAPVLEAILSTHFTDHAFGGMEYDLRNNRFHFDTEDTTGFFGKTWATNLLFDDKPENINYTAPWRAYLSLGDENWNFQFGRDTIRWGSGFLGNLFINDHADFHEYARLTAFNEAFKFSTIAMIFDHPDTYAVGTETSPKASDPITGFKLFIAHRLELPITSRIRLAISEYQVQLAEPLDDLP